MDRKKQEFVDSLPFDSMSLESLGAFMFYGPLDSTMARSACEFILKSNILCTDSDALTIFINTEGGVTNDGFSIIDTMETSRIPVQTVGLGQVASMGLLVLSAGHKGTRTITKNTEVMAHQYHGGIEGKFHELMAVTNEFMRLRELFISHFLRHTNMSRKQIEDVLFSTTDRWLTPKECKKYGLIDRVVEYAEPPRLNLKAR